MAAKTKLVKKVSGEERVAEVRQPTSGRLKGRYCVTAQLNESEAQRSPIRGAKSLTAGCFGANADGKAKAIERAEQLAETPSSKLFKRRR